MARTKFMWRGDSVIGIFPEDFERGFVPGRRGLRRKLCTRSELDRLSDDRKKSLLHDLYLQKEYEIKQSQINEKLARSKKKAEKKKATLKEVANKWLSEVKEIKRIKTYNTYKKSIDLYISIVGNHPLSDFDREKNMDFFIGLRNVENPTTKKPIAASTQNAHMRQLQIFLNWAYDNEYMQRRILLKKEKVPQKDMETFTIEQVELLEQLLKQRADENMGKRFEKKYLNLYRAFLLARHTLLRVGHIWSLKLECIDLDSQFIRITENTELGWYPKGLKWPNKHINKTLYEFLKEDLKNRDSKERYFLDGGDGKPWCHGVDVISKNMRKLCNELGLPKNVKPFHWGVRATFITWLLNEGVDPVKVQHLADHSDLATTMKYFNTRVANQKSAADLLG